MSALVVAAAGGIPGGVATVISALLAAFIGVVSLAVNAARATRDRRRDLYSQAYKVSMSWIEMAYRAHHCRMGDDKAFLDSYHKLWEEGRYFEGWMWTESEELGYSYQAFTEAVRSVCEPFIEGTWEQRSQSTRPLQPLPVEPTPQTYKAHIDAFLRDAREHLSFNPLTRHRMRRRVRARIQAAPTEFARDVAESVGHGEREDAYIPPRVGDDLT
jgi:hypothetical protein